MRILTSILVIFSIFSILESSHARLAEEEKMELHEYDYHKHFERHSRKANNISKRIQDEQKKIDDHHSGENVLSESDLLYAKKRVSKLSADHAAHTSMDEHDIRRDAHDHHKKREETRKRRESRKDDDDDEFGRRGRRPRRNSRGKEF